MPGSWSNIYARTESMRQGIIDAPRHTFRCTKASLRQLSVRPADALEVRSGKKQVHLNFGLSVEISVSPDSLSAYPGVRRRKIKDMSSETVIATFLHGSLEDVKRLVAGLLDVDAILVPEDGYTALHLAATSGASEKVRAVLARNAKLEIHSRNQKFTPLHTAVINDHGAAVSLLLDAGADVLATANDGLQAIHLGGMRGHANVVKILLQWGADVHATEVNGATPLHAAAFYGFTDVARMLLAAGADPNRKDKLGHTPMALARQRGHTALLSLLEKPASAAGAGTTAEAAANKAGRLLTFGDLSEVVENGRIDVVKDLIRNGQKFAGLVSSTGHTLLHMAAIHDRGDLVPILVEAGVPKNQKDHIAYETPLHTAVKNSHFSAARALLASGADTDARNINKWTVLHDAAYNGNIPMIELLLKYKVDLDAKEMTDSTPTAVAVLNQQLRAAKFLRQRGGWTHIWQNDMNDYAPKDYYPLLAKAVRNLNPNTPETRRTVYRRARKILAEHLSGSEIPRGQAEAEKSSIEIAIDRIEQEHA